MIQLAQIARQYNFFYSDSILNPAYISGNCSIIHATCHLAKQNNNKKKHKNTLTNYHISISDLQDKVLLASDINYLRKRIHANDYLEFVTIAFVFISSKKRTPFKAQTCLFRVILPPSPHSPTFY